MLPGGRIRSGMWQKAAKKGSPIGLIVATCLAAGLAMAQSDASNPYAVTCNHKATPEDLEGAKGAHKAAEQFYDRGEYERAIQYWNDVYRFDCEATLVLQNIANAYEKLGDRKSAITALEGYLLREPNASDAAQISRKVENLKNLIKPQPSATASAPPASASTTTPPVPTASATAVPTTTGSSALPPPPMVKPFGVAPWVTVGVGGAAALAGGILLPMGLSAVSSAQKNCTKLGDDKFACPNDADLQKARSGQTQVLIGKIAIGVGGAAVVGGLVWELAFNKPVPSTASAPPSGTPSTSKVRVTPLVGPGVGGVSVQGSF